MFSVSMPILTTEIVDFLVNNEIYCYCVLVVGKLIVVEFSKIIWGN